MTRYDLSTFGLSEMTMAGAALRRLGKGSSTFEDAGQRAARFFHDHFSDASGRPAFVLSRCYTTVSVRDLTADLGTFATGVFPDVPLDPETQCLTLLGSYGDDPAWQSRSGSNGHKAIPLTSAAILESLPMVARLVASLGLAADDVVHPDSSFLLERERRGFNVFHVEHAVGSPYIPAQSSFVVPFGVQSVVGFGFVIPPTHVFTTILFARQYINGVTADLFKTLALSLKLTLLEVAGKPIFEGAR